MVSRAPLIDYDAAVAIVAASGARLVAIDGLPVSGKSTLASRCEAELQAHCVYFDDFVRPEAEWRSRSVPSFPFGYVRYDEFMGVVVALAKGVACTYRPYDWSTGVLGDVRHIDPAGLWIIEGVSALHPELSPLYDLRVWVESDPATTMVASIERGVGDWEQEWRDLFLPSTELYLRTQPRERADYLVAGRGADRLD